MFSFRWLILCARAHFVCICVRSSFFVHVRMKKKKQNMNTNQLRIHVHLMHARLCIFRIQCLNVELVEFLFALSPLRLLSRIGIVRFSFALVFGYTTGQSKVSVCCFGVFFSFRLHCCVFSSTAEFFSSIPSVSLLVWWILTVELSAERKNNSTLQIQ